ncbi:unnamed protein product [Sphagnum troendelagicum]|uniref:Uncharacterized protein n=1 Tax=Sphagnum troendelagicum TaxID=128251 RepID=A0ABP0V3T1_9BRYO
MLEDDRPAIEEKQEESSTKALEMLEDARSEREVSEQEPTVAGLGRTCITVMRFSEFLQGDEFGLISSMVGRYSVAEESPLRDSVKSPLKGGKGEWSITVRFSIPMRDCNMLAT